MSLRQLLQLDRFLSDQMELAIEDLRVRSHQLDIAHELITILVLAALRAIFHVFEADGLLD